jgi:hypothetical protein
VTARTPKYRPDKLERLDPKEPKVKALLSEYDRMCRAVDDGWRVEGEARTPLQKAVAEYTQRLLTRGIRRADGGGRGPPINRPLEVLMDSAERLNRIERRRRFTPETLHALLGEHECDMHRAGVSIPIATLRKYQSRARAQFEDARPTRSERSRALHDLLRSRRRNT